MKEGTKRIHLLDELRGFAIICMIIHHTFYDIGFILGHDWGTQIFNLLCVIQPFFWGIFIIISGVCSRLSRSPIKRGIIVLCAGGIITFLTAVIMPAIGITGEEIYFGILSCLGASMVIAGILMPLIEKVDVRVGTLVCLVLFVVTYTITDKSLLFGLIKLPDCLYQYNIFAPFGFFNDTFYSADYFSIFPWVFLFLAGAFLGKAAKEQSLPKSFYKSHSTFLQKVGKNSLLVYLLHQPILFVIMYIISFIEMLFLLFV